MESETNEIRDRMQSDRKAVGSAIEEEADEKKKEIALLRYI